MFKNCKVKMLSTEEESRIHKQNGNIYFTPNLCRSVIDKNYHLSILSDDEIYEGDWILFNHDMSAPFVDKISKLSPYGMFCNITNDDTDYMINRCRKIIATTDSSLNIETCKECAEIGIKEKCPERFTCPCNKLLPKPSDDFIKEFCEKGGIWEVMVEYECICDINTPMYKLKVNVDNTINIHPVKESWNREEVVSLCTKAWKQGHFGGQVEGRFVEIEEWIKENFY